MANMPLTTSIRDRVGAGALPAGEQVQRRDRLLGPPLVHDEGREQRDADRRTRHRARIGPAGRGGPDEAVDEGGHAEGRGGRAGQVEVAVPAVPTRAGSAGRASIRTTPIGTLMNSAQRQETQVVSMPPSTRPMLPPPPATAL